MGAETMLDAIQAQGSKSLLVSGGFTFFTERLQPRLNLTYTRANTLEIIDGKLTGKVLGTIVDGNEKAATVRQVCNELGIGTHEALV
ncbi:haloacid dehalogenase-like hydrolase, partial [Acinetobacter baumannii]